MVIKLLGKQISLYYNYF